MAKLLSDIGSVPEELRFGLRQLEPELSALLAAVPGPLPELRFARAGDLAPGACRVVHERAGAASILYGDLAGAWRALGRLAGALPAGIREDFTESPAMSMRCLMLDCSRNGVITVATGKYLLRRLALMGFNSLMLYTEDTYEVPGEAFFGYLRGGYTQAELRELDDYAAGLGIEMFPCIQTLGHLSQVLQWEPYAGLADVSGVLTAGDEQAYAFIEKMIAAASAPFRSRRIHVGMDEAWGMGTGKYRKKFGEHDKFDIFNRHLGRVADICRANGLQPLIWSDMYFHLASEHSGGGGSSAGTEIRIPEKVGSQIPSETTLVGWEYGRHDQEYYEWFIDTHRRLGREPAIATAACTTSRFWCALPFSFAAIGAALRACRGKGVRQAMLTVWGDDGMNCDYFSSLRAMQFFAEQTYAEEVDHELLRRNFRANCGGADLDAWVMAAEIDENPHLRRTPGSQHPGNGGYGLFWQDPLLAVLEPSVDGAALRRTYAELADRLGVAAAGDAGNGRLRLPAQFARVMAHKCHLRSRLAEAYAGGDRAALRQLLEGDLTALRQEMAAMWRLHRTVWMGMFQPFGWEVVDCRYGRMLARLDTAAARLEDFLEGRVAELPELAAQLQNLFPDAPPETIPLVYYNGFLVSPSTIRV